MKIYQITPIMPIMHITQLSLLDTTSQPSYNNHKGYINHIELILRYNLRKMFGAIKQVTSKMMELKLTTSINTLRSYHTKYIEYKRADSPIFAKKLP